MIDTRTLLGHLGVWGLVTVIRAAELRRDGAQVTKLGYGALCVG